MYLPGMTTIEIRLFQIIIYSNAMFNKHKTNYLGCVKPIEKSNIVRYLTCTEDRAFDVQLRGFYLYIHYMEY